MGGLGVFGVSEVSLTANMSHNYNRDTNALAILSIPLTTALLYKSFLLHYLLETILLSSTFSHTKGCFVLYRCIRTQKD